MTLSKSKFTNAYRTPAVVIVVFALVFPITACRTPSKTKPVVKTKVETQRRDAGTQDSSSMSRSSEAQSQQTKASSVNLEPIAGQLAELSARLAKIEHAIEVQRPSSADTLRLSRLQDSVRLCLAVPNQSVALSTSDLKRYYFRPGMTSWKIAQESMHSNDRRAYFKIMEACPPCKQDFSRLSTLVSAGRVKTPVTIVVQSGDRNVAFNLATGSYFINSRLVDYVWDYEGVVSESLGVADAPSWALQDQGNVVERYKGVSTQRAWQNISSFLAKTASRKTLPATSEDLTACIWDALNESHNVETKEKG